MNGLCCHKPWFIQVNSRVLVVPYSPSLFCKVSNTNDVTKIIFHNIIKINLNSLILDKYEKDVSTLKIKISKYFKIFFLNKSQNLNFHNNLNTCDVTKISSLGIVMCSQTWIHLICSSNLFGGEMTNPSESLKWARYPTSSCLWSREDEWR